MCRTLVLVLATIALAGCHRDRSKPLDVPAVVAHVLCDWYWKAPATGRPYDSLAECITAETRPRPCNATQARACAEFTKPLHMDGAHGLYDSPDCKACLDPSKDAWARDQLQEQKDRLQRATLTIHSATVHMGPAPADLGPGIDASSIVVKVDVELTGYGVRIDPDDFQIETASGAQRDVVGSQPYCERLGHDGKPVDWRDPSVVDDPDLRMLAYFRVPTSARGKTLVVSYEKKYSAPFEPR